jgi:hypothetical protein
MSNPKVKVTVTGHHNSDYRQTTFRFVDKGSTKANYAHALKVAIKKEAEWTGWYEEDCGELRGREKIVAEQIDQLFKPNVVDGVTVVYGYDDETNNEKVSEHVGLVVWHEKSKDMESGLNVGFGMAYHSDKKVGLNDTNKYNNRWISISKG